MLDLDGKITYLYSGDAVAYSILSSWSLKSWDMLQRVSVLV